MMVDRDVGGAGSALRRRERRLRSWWRHEQRSVAAALATVTHHSSQVGTKNDGLRAQKTVTSAGGKRPAPLEEVAGPQDAVDYVAVARPLGSPPLVQGGDGVDGTTLRWVALKQKQIEEEKKENEEGAAGGDDRGVASCPRADSWAFGQKKEEEEEETSSRSPSPLLWSTSP